MRYIFLLTLIVYAGCNTQNTDFRPFDFADPMVGTGGTGHTFPGATLPFGMIQLSPSNDFKGWNWCAGYHYSDSVIKGFAHNHISGPGLTGLGDILMTAVSGEAVTDPGSEENPDSGYRSRFSHNHEVAIPGYYAVHLDDYDIDVELTCTDRTGLHRYTFNRPGQSGIVIDPTHRIMESLFGTTLEVISDHEVRGMKYSEGEAGRRKVWFYATFSHPFDSYRLVREGLVTDSSKISGVNCRGWFGYNNDSTLSVTVKTGLSFTGYEGARKNLISEAADIDFYDVRARAITRWEEVFAKISVRSGDEHLLRNFYTALYHSFQSPNIISDTDGSYTLDGTLYQSDITQYSRFSTWDTYRALHPLFTIIEHEKTAEFVNSMASRHTVTGQGLPVWELCGHDNVCMIGYSPASVIAEAIVKGIEGIDTLAAYNAIRAAAFNTDKVSPNSGPSGLAEYIATGYVPSEINQSVSKTSEYAYHDWSISRVARLMGRSEDEKLFTRRAYGFINHFNPATSYLWPKSATGNWTPMDTTIWDDLISHYISGNIWGYSSYVPHAMPELIELFGGYTGYGNWLDRVMSDTSTIGGSQHVDISGFIGKYGHGDEPTHQMPWLYAYVGQPWKTQELTREVMNTMYSPEPGGLVNNDDLGQMSAWYIFGAMGLYPVSPVDKEYILGSPIFSEITVFLPGGEKKFVVKAPRTSARRIYVRSVKLNGKRLKRAFITHEEIMAGGTLEFRMSSRKSRRFGTDPAVFPGRRNFEYDNLPESKVPFMPYDTLVENVFYQSATIALFCNTPGASIEYSTTGDEDPEGSIIYTKPIMTNGSLSLHATSFVGKEKGIPFRREYFVSALPRLEPGYPVAVPEPGPEGYGEGRPGILVDRITGSDDFADGKWAGFNGRDLEVLLDPGEEISIESITVGSLVKTISWIFPPSGIRVSVSDDMLTWKSVGSKGIEALPEQSGPYVERYTVGFSPVRCRYLKIEIDNYGQMPFWHGAAGTKPWLFIDEIIMNIVREQ